MQMRFVMLVLWSVSLLGASCGQGKGQSNEKAASAAPIDIYVFVDKSKSVSFQASEIFDKAEKSFTQALGFLKNEGDRISIFYIHANTGAASTEYSFTVPPLVYPKNSNKIDRNTHKKNYNYTLALERGKALNAFRQSLRVDNATGSEKATDILGALEVISKNCDSSRQKHILILSDGIQTSNGFSVNPKNLQEAEAKAGEHLQRIPDLYQINKGNLTKARAYMILPFTALGTSHNRFLNAYWQKVFADYGVHLVSL